MKKFNKFVMLLLILPLCFSFSACKEKNSSNNNQNEQPSGDDVSLTKYTINYDYNLPSDYDYLLKDYQILVAVGSSKTLDSVTNEKLSPYFEGWTENGEDIITSVSSDTSKTINLTGKWNETGLKNYYYTDGLIFSVENGKAFVSEYDGSDTTIIVPKYYKQNNVDYEVKGIVDKTSELGVFEGKTVNKFIINPNEFSVGDNAFKNSNLLSFDFSRIEEIGYNAFTQTKLSSLNFSNKLKSIGECAFKNCLNLSSITFDQSTVSNTGLDVKVGDESFSGCVNLQSVNLGESVKFISQKMFYNCENLISVSGAGLVKEIYPYAFYGCCKINDLNFFGNSLTIIGSNAFENCSQLQALTLSSNIKTLGESVFAGCNKITELSIGCLYGNSGTIKMKLKDFIGIEVAENIKTINLIGNNINTLTEGYFTGFDSLEKFTMSNSVETVQDYAFSGCENLKEIVLSPAIKEGKISYKAFSGTKFLAEITTPILIENDSVILYVPSNIEADYTIPNTVKKINKEAFLNKTSLRKITIPSSVEYIGENAFAGCSNLQEVVFETNENITSIEKYTFGSCTKLNSINLLSLTALSTIKDGAFYRTNIDTIQIPKTVESLGQKSFYGVNASKVIVEDGNTVFKSEDDVLYGLGADGNIEKLILYPMNKQGSLFICPENVKTICSDAFVSVKHLSHVYLSNNDVLLEDDVFDVSNYLNVYSSNNDFDKSKIGGAYLYNEVSISDASYNPNDNSITIEESFSVNCQTLLEKNRSLLFVKYTDTTTNKIYIISFEIKSETQDNKITYSAVQNSIKKIETSLIK